MKKSLHPLFFASLLEKYYFYFVWPFLVTIWKCKSFASFYILAEEIVQGFIISHAKFIFSFVSFSPSCGTLC